MKGPVKNVFKKGKELKNQMEYDVNELIREKHALILRRDRKTLTLWTDVKRIELDREAKLFVVLNKQIKIECQTTQQQEELFLQLLKQVRSVKKCQLKKHGVFYLWPAWEPVELKICKPAVLHVGTREINIQHKTIDIFMGRKHNDLLPSPRFEDDDKLLFSIEIRSKNFTANNLETSTTTTLLFHFRASSEETRTNWLNQLHLFIVQENALTSSTTTSTI